MQLVIYGLDGALVPNENIQSPNVSGAIHNITQYLVTYLAPGGPAIPINAIITAVADNQAAQVAAAFDKAVTAGYIPQLLALLQQVRHLFVWWKSTVMLPLTWPSLLDSTCCSSHLCSRCAISF